MRQIDFLFFDAGGGHRAAANALRSLVEEQGRSWQVELVNLQETLDSLDIIRQVTGVRLQDAYNRMLASGKTLGSRYLLMGTQLLIRLYHPLLVRALGRFWAQRKPDLVVSLVPNFNRALLAGLRRAHPEIPFVTVLTDFADYPPHFWIERQKQFLICGTERAAEQARSLGHPETAIFRVSGMILRPGFYRSFNHDRASERRKLGLLTDVPVGLVLFGGHGSPKMLRIAEQLQSCQRPVQLIALCGRNEVLAEQLRHMATRFPIHVAGFTEDVPYYMSLSDFFIGKPGPGSISEAVAMGLPVVIERNAWTLPQERYNADWVTETGTGLVVGSFEREIRSAVDALLERDVLARYRERVAAIRNRAVFEVLEILASLMGEHSGLNRESARAPVLK